MRPLALLTIYLNPQSRAPLTIDLQGVIQSLWMAFYPYFVQCDFPHARLMAEEALAQSLKHPEVCTEWGVDWTQGYSAFLAGYVAVWDGRYEQARTLLVQASTSMRQAGDSFVLAWTTLLRSEAAVFEDKQQEGHTLLAQEMPYYKALGMTVLLAEAQILQGLLYRSSGKLVEARAVLEESLRLSQEVQDERRITWAKIALARVALCEQDTPEASRLLSSALDWSIHKHDQAMVTLGLEGWGALLTLQGRLDQAIRAFAAAYSVRQLTGSPMPPIDQSEYQRHLETIRASLDTKKFELHWEQGRRMTPRQAMGEYVSLLPGESPGAGGRALVPGNLTPREADVLRLVAEGLSNQQIAEQLGLKTVTVNAYLRSIYNKLGVSSRTQATRFAYEHHLLS